MSSVSHAGPPPKRVLTVLTPGMRSRYIASGHYFYITGRIPDRKDSAAIDAKLIALYDIAKLRWARAR